MKDDLLKLWARRMEMWESMHDTDMFLINIMDKIIKEQQRQACKHTFWWHIKAAFISLLWKADPLPPNP